MATILLQNVGASTLTFTQKLQLAASGGTGAGPAGTVYDCTSYSNQAITSTITFTVANNTFIFGGTAFTFSPTTGSMFVISAPGITLQGTTRSARDAGETGATSFRMSAGADYHINYAISNQIDPRRKGDSLVLRNLNFRGTQSVYTSNSGLPVYTTNGVGGIFITEPNLNASGSNVNNVIIENVLVDGAKQHGIMIYGAVASKIRNSRVKSAAGHGFYIDGESTSTSFDTCYASGNYLAGFCLKDAAYSSLNNCASDSNGLGYWLRNTTSTTLVSCGAEANLTRSNIPNNLGILIKLYPSGNITLNDIGADNVNHIKGTSFFFSGGSHITVTSPLSKDPGGNPGTGVYINKRTAHFGFYGGVDRVNITTPRLSGTTTLKYKYRLETLNAGSPTNITIDALVNTYDPINPNETPDTTLVAVADVLDQGSNNTFGNIADSITFTGTRSIVQNTEENHRFNTVQVSDRFNLPTFTAHPANPQDGTIYFNTALNKLYIYNGAWYDTCCATGPTPLPDCVFPNGGASTLTPIDFRASYFYTLGTKTYFLSNAIGYNLTDNPEAPILMVFDSSTEVLTPLVTRNDVFGLQSLIQFIPSTLAYSSLTNSFYVGFLWNYGNTEGFTLSDSYSKLIKYNLNTATIDATVDEYIGFDPVEASADKVFGTGQVRYVAQGSTLKQINLGYYSDDIDALKPVVIVNRNINTLEIISQVTGDDIKANSEGQSGPFVNNNMINDQILITDNRILTNVILNQGDTALKFGVLDLTNGLMSYVTYDTLASPYPGYVNYVRMTFSKSQTDSSVFFLTDSISGKIYEIDLNTFNIENEWSLGLPTYGVYDYIVNSVRFLVFTSASYNTQNSLYEWKLTTFNTVSSELTYSTYIISYTSNINQQFYSATLQNGMVFKILNDSMYAASPLKIQQFCAPYAV